ncbi:MAG: alpha/beta hydrolase-fold protein [Ruminococcus sp.]|nr:alpha/beta hydrolase-fold protein [Ruminococcus sp.]
MVFKKSIGRALSALTAAAMLATSAQVLPKSDEKLIARAASACVIDTQKEYQLIRGFGGINHPEWTGADLSESQRQTSFGNGTNELGLSVLRVFVNPDKNQWYRAVETAKFANKMGAYVFASPWEPPSSIASKGDGTYQGGKVHLNKSNYGAYAQHLNDFGTYMKNQGVDLFSISVQNEPDYAHDWTGWTSDETTDFLANYGHLITSTRMMSPETFQYTNKDYYNKILNNSKAFANTDVFATHMYGTQRSQMDFSALENCGKEIWMTEVYVPNSDADSANRWPEALQVGENIHNALVVGNMSAYVWWYIRRSYGLLTEDGKISKRGYNMAQFSKWVRPGAIRIGATEQPDTNILVSSYKNEDGTIAIVAINKNSSGSVVQEFKLGSGEKIGSVDRYRTSSSENLALTANMEASESGFFATLPAQSISTFVITPEGGIKQPEADEYGWWFQCGFEDGDDNWTNRGGNTVAVSDAEHYTEWGSKSLFVSDRTSEWMGASLELSNKIFTAGHAYSFSVHVKQNTEETVDFKLSLEYTDSTGETAYSDIAKVTAPKGQWAQLHNKSYKIPDGATNLKIYVETTSSLTDFYMDEAIGAVDGTGIQGEGQPELPEVKTVIPGDINFDGKINIFDVVMARKGVIAGGFSDDYAVKAADVDNNGKVEAADLVQISSYVMGRITQFTKVEGSSGTMMTISEYTPLAQAKLAMNETNESKQEKSGVQYGTVVSKSYYSEFCKREKKYNVLLPAGYSTSKKYPVMYVMHGYWENQDRMIIKGNNTMYTRQIVGNAIAEGAAKDMILVFPYIYSSQTQNDCNAMDDANNIAYDNFATVLVNELMPLIEKEYSVATGKANTAITGFSMGGRESLNIGQKYPDLFGYVGAICPAPGASGNWKFASEEASPSLIYITAGGNDEVVYTTPEGYHNNFTKNNVPHIWHYYQNGYHGDNSIHAHLYNFVRFAFQA